MRPPLSTAFRAQQGAASLIIAVLLLFAGTLIAFFANRGLIFEQRTSANQYRSTTAFELAEAGIEWGIGKLNERLPLAGADSCVPQAGAAFQSFRERYANPIPPTPPALISWSFNVPGDQRYAECRFDPTATATNGGWTCSCPGARANLTDFIALGSPEQRRFGVTFRPVPGNPTAVEVVARGCTNGASCDPRDATPTDRDSTAVVRVLVTLRPAVSGGPTAALTAGLATTTGGSLNVINQHAPSNGITIHSGSSVETGGGNKLFTLPGTPVASSVLDNDPSLYNITTASEDAFFARYLGEPLSEFCRAGGNTIILSGSASENADALMARVATGESDLSFCVNGDLTFTGGGGNAPTIGTAERPVIVVVRGDLTITGGRIAYGLFYSANSLVDAQDPGAGGAVIYGAYIVRGQFTKQGNGNFSIVYTPTLWGSGRPTGDLLKVPGSWRDF